MPTNQTMPTKVVTGEVRLSYVHLVKPYSNQPGQPEKFSVTLLIPKSDIVTKQKIDAAIQAAIQQGIKDKWNGVKPPIVAVPIYDGDGTRPSDGMPFGEECKGHWVMTASTKQRPEVVDINLQPILNETEIYSGMYGRVSINFFPYAVQGKKGIGCGLNNVQKLRDGEPLGGRSSATDDFGDLPVPGESYAQPAVSPYGAGGTISNPVSPQQPQYQHIQQGYLTGSAYPQQNYAQPQYQQPQQAAYPQQQYQKTAPQIDPITGKPMTGPVMGVDDNHFPF